MTIALWISSYACLKKTDGNKRISFNAGGESGQCKKFWWHGKRLSNSELLFYEQKPKASSISPWPLKLTNFESKQKERKSLPRKKL